jgi:phage terminase small subunit
MGTEVFPRVARHPQASQADRRQASRRVGIGRQDGQIDVMVLTAKQETFAVAVAKGSNASDAYRGAYSTGRMSAKSINEEASHLLAHPKVASRVAELRAPAMKAARLEIEETLRQLACVLRSDARRLFRPDGSLIPVHELDDATAAAISSIDLDDQGRPKKIRLWSKTDAIDKAMRHLGLYERDNRAAENLAIQINLV